MSNSSFEDFELAEDEKEKLKFLTCPVPVNENKRIAVLQQTRLMDSSPAEESFDRFTHLATLIFNMPVSLITLVDVDRVWFKSRCGVDWTDVCRNDSFDAYAIHPDYPEVFVVPDVSTDLRFKDCDLKLGNAPIRFYAGAAIMLQDVRIGSLCILDTEPHPEFSLEDKENLLDLCVGVSQLAYERRQHTLNLNAERANIVVSMMHNLRTPMTSLNFASSMLATEAFKLRPGGKKHRGDGCALLDEDDEGSDDGVAGGNAGHAGHMNSGALLRTPSSAAGNVLQPAPTSRDNSPIPTIELTPTEADGGSSADSKGDSPAPTAAASSATNVDNIESAFSTFDDCFREITSALKQLNLVVDSSLNLGQAIVKISDPPSAVHGSNRYGSRDYLGSLSGGISEKSGVALASACLSAIHSAVPSANASAHSSPKVVAKHDDGKSSDAAAAEIGLYPEMENSRYVACNLIDYIETVYSTLISQVVGVNVSWEVNPAYLGLGRHASHPEAVSLVLISTLGQLRTQHKNVRIRFHFEKLEHDEDIEFPELADKLIEGMLVIRIQAYTKMERSARSPKRVPTTDASSVHSSPMHVDNAHSSLKEGTDISNKTSATSTSAALSAISNISERLQLAASEQAEDHNDYNSSYNLLSVNKILRTVNGGCKEYLEAVPELRSRSVDRDAELQLGEFETPLPEPPLMMPTQQFWIPCKILPSAEVLASMALGESLDAAVGPRGVGSAQDTIMMKHFNESSSVLTKWDSTLSKSSRSSKFTDGMSNKLEPDPYSTSAPSSMKAPRANTSPSNFKSAASEKARTALGAGFPAVPEGTERALEVARSPGGGNSTAADPKLLRVLIIEDTLSVQKLLSRWMQKAGCKVTCANNGSVGLNQLMTACFDIVFVDFLMPVMLGVTTMKLFQAWMRDTDPLTNEVAAYNSQLLIVGMSATALESEQEAAFDFGMHFFCPKPTNMDVLGLMLEAKRQCDTNEGALNMICQATGTDYFAPDAASPREDEMLSGRERANSADQAVLSAQDSTQNLLDRTIATVQRDGSTNSLNKGSDKGSEKVSGKGSRQSSGSISVIGVSENAAILAASASAVITTLGSSSGSFAGNSPGIATHSPGHGGSLLGPHQCVSTASNASTAVTDSKSAAMWSVFRSYRQTRRNVFSAGASASAIGGVSASAGAAAVEADVIAQV